jgi:hypothetical protein
VGDATGQQNEEKMGDNKSRCQEVTIIGREYRLSLPEMRCTDLI